MCNLNQINKHGIKKYIYCINIKIKNKIICVV